MSELLEGLGQSPSFLQSVNDVFAIAFVESIHTNRKRRLNKQNQRKHDKHQTKCSLSLQVLVTMNCPGSNLDVLDGFCPPALDEFTTAITFSLFSSACYLSHLQTCRLFGACHSPLHLNINWNRQTSEGLLLLVLYVEVLFSNILVRISFWV